MAEVAVIVHTHTALAERVAGWESKDGQAMVTWALCFMQAVPSAADVAVIRAAAKVCDRVAVVIGTRSKEQGTGKVLPNLPAVLREAGADVVWVVKEKKGFVVVDCGVPEVDGTVLMQGICAVLPLCVVVHRADVLLVRALRNLMGGIGEMFSLRITG